MDPTLEEVAKQLKAGSWRFQRVKLKDKPTYHSNTYEVFHLLYDENSKVILHFYLCQKCKKIINSNLNAEGNYKLRRHACYKEHQQKLREAKIEEEGENSKTDVSEKGSEQKQQMKAIDAKNFFLSDVIDIDAEYESEDNASGGKNDDDVDDVDDVDDAEKIGAAALASYLFKFSKLVHELGLFPKHIISQFIPESFDVNDW